MSEKNKGRNTDDAINSSIIELIYQDANESVDILRSNLNSVNTKLTILIGFNATFITLLSRLVNQTSISIDVQKELSKAEFYPHASQLYELILFLLNWCLLIKPLVSILIIASALSAITGIMPTPVPSTIFPSALLDKGKERSEEEFRKAVILNRNETMNRLQTLTDRKATSLKHSLLLLGIATSLLAANILTV